MADTEDSYPPSIAEPQLASGLESVMDPELFQEIERELKLQKLLSERRSVHTDDERAKAWSEVAKKARTFGDDMVDRWEREIKTYLLFAGLFSAILTAFNVQSYQMLHPGGTDPTVQALERISLQLHSFSISYPFVNSTHPAGPFIRDTTEGATSSSVTQSAIWLNSLWFFGLILSLASTLIGIVAKQWLSEYRAMSGTSREKARLRQYRAKNLEAWHVGDIILLIPVLLVISLAFFFAGLLVLLWTLHRSVAIVASVFIALVAIFTLTVAILPVVNVSCGYLSPQSRALYSIFQHIIRPVFILLWAYCLYIPVFYLIRLIYAPVRTLIPILAQYLFYHTNISERFDHVMLWLMFKLPPVPAPDLDWPEPLPWNDRIKAAINAAGDTLDVELLVTAYESTLDPDAVTSAAICLPELQSGGVLNYFKKLHVSIVNHSRVDDSDEATTESSSGYPTPPLLIFHVFLCAADLAIRAKQYDLCKDVWVYLSSPLHHVWTTTADTKKGDKNNLWLRDVVGWLRSKKRIGKYLAPIFEHNITLLWNSAVGVKIIQDHCEKLYIALVDPEEQDQTGESYRPTISARQALKCLYNKICKVEVQGKEEMESAGDFEDSATETSACVGLGPRYLLLLRDILRTFGLCLLEPVEEKNGRLLAGKDVEAVLEKWSSAIYGYETFFEGTTFEDIGEASHPSYTCITLLIEIMAALSCLPVQVHIPPELLSDLEKILDLCWNLPPAQQEPTPQGSTTGAEGEETREEGEGQSRNAALLHVSDAKESLRVLREYVKMRDTQGDPATAMTPPVVGSEDNLRNPLTSIAVDVADGFTSMITRLRESSGLIRRPSNFDAPPLTPMAHFPPPDLEAQDEPSSAVNNPENNHWDTNATIQEDDGDSAVSATGIRTPPRGLGTVTADTQPPGSAVSDSANNRGDTAATTHQDDGDIAGSGFSIDAADSDAPPRVHPVAHDEQTVPNASLPPHTINDVAPRSGIVDTQPQ
ncbi:hypothetical protein C2E23DRAFT_531971 [Lenzites betulinus]|nr:hypothetical protein C2E23DRAFT_531971 [Lenzites betulinus]